jgi:hypothetical protein
MGARVLERLGGSLSALRQQVLEASEAAAAAEAAAVAGPTAERGAEHELWAADWGHAQSFQREPRFPPAAILVRQLLTPIDRRLANIERHLGIAADEEAAPGFRGLVMSVNRHLAAIERHLGIAEDPEAGEKGPEKEAE